MGIHVSCDFCWKTVEKDYVEIQCIPQSRLFEKFTLVACRPCMREREYLHLSVKNPNYIAPPPTEEAEVKETTDGNAA